MYKRISLLALATFMTSAAAATAMAADLAPPPPPPAPEIRPSVTDWTGPYLGAVVGGTCMDTNFSTTTTYTVSDPANEANPAQTNNDPALNGCGLSGGFVGGFNYQIGDAVLGFEGDFSWGQNKTGDHHDTTSAGDKIGEYYNVKWRTSLRARAGWLMNNDTLLYVTGGPSWLRGELEDILTSQKDTNTHVGYTVGGGLEHAVTENIHIRAEYMFSSYKTKDYGPYNCTACVDDVAGGDAVNENSSTVAHHSLDAIHTFRVGLTWNFPVSTW